MVNKSKKSKGFLAHFVSLLWTVRSLIFLILILIILGSCIFAIEGFSNGSHSFWLALYMAFISALTIGYGDFAPDGPLGMITYVVLGILGIVLMGIIVGAVIKAIERSTKNI